MKKKLKNPKKMMPITRRGWLLNALAADSDS
jgi:hypothetical protein